MNIKKGDNVIMLTGKDRAKRGKVLSVLPKEKKVLVEGLNTVKKHQRARKEGQKGQILDKERPVDISNVQLVCDKCDKPTRVGHKITGTPAAPIKLRVCKKCGAELKD